MSNLWFSGEIGEAVGLVQSTDKILIVLGISTNQNDQLSEMGKGFNFLSKVQIIRSKRV